MARRTHRMIGINSAVRGTGNPTQANSITAPCAKVFASCEDSVPSAEITDIINSTDFITAALSCAGACTLTAGRDSYSIRTGSPPPDNAIDGDPATWADPAGSDWLYFATISPYDDTGGSESRAVYIEQSLVGSTGAVRCFPYKCGFRDSGVPPKEAECYDLTGNYTIAGGQNYDNCSGLDLETDVIYTIVAAKRGDLLEHYFDGVLVGSIDVVATATANGWSQILTDWAGFDGGDGIELTHSGYSGDGCDGTVGVGHMRGDWYGVAQFIFADGLPPQASIEAGMDWMKDQWSQGNKVIYPEWIAL